MHCDAVDAQGGATASGISTKHDAFSVVCKPVNVENMLESCQWVMPQVFGPVNAVFQGCAYFGPVDSNVVGGWHLHWSRSGTPLVAQMDLACIAQTWWQTV